MARAVDIHVSRRAADPAAIDAELRALWSEMAREQPLARAIMSNLVVLKARTSEAPVDVTTARPPVPLAEVARRHPARILLLFHTPGTPADCPPLSAAVAIVTFGAPPARYGVEAIIVDSRCRAAALPSIVRRMTFGDLPTTLWWADDLSRAAPDDALSAIGRQVMYDSRQWTDLRAGFAAAAHLLTRDIAPDVADLNWRRLGPMQSALASIVRVRSDALERSFEATVEHRPGERALAHLLVGWIAARMRWAADAWPVRILESAAADPVLRLTLSDSRGDVVVATQDDQRVFVRDTRVEAPIVMPVPHQSIEEAVAMELNALRQDECLREAILAAAAQR